VTPGLVTVDVEQKRKNCLSPPENTCGKEIEIADDF